MKKKLVKLSGKENAKLNKRKKFYEKFERFINEPIILITMNKGISFPEFDELSILFKDDYVKFEAEIDFDQVKSIEISYYEEAHFLLKTSKLEYLSLVRIETFVDNEGNERRGQSGADDSYNYQAAFNWGIQVKNIKETLKLLEQEKENPSEHDMTQEPFVRPEPMYRKSWKPPRRRRN